jgi:sugar lactone lactonase YvrE
MRFKQPSKLYSEDQGLFESPLYIHERGLLVFVSINAREVIVFDLSGWKTNKIKTEGECSWVGFNPKTRLLLWADTLGLWEYDFDSSRRALMAPVSLPDGMRFNDASFVDGFDLLIGSKSIKDDRPGESVLFHFNQVDGFAKILRGLTIPNGMAFFSERKFFFAESFDHKIYQCSWDASTRDIVLENVFLEFGPTVFPDGICLVDDSALAVAEWGGGKVSIWNTENCTLITEILFDDPFVSSVELASERKSLFVTTAKLSDDLVEGANLYEVEYAK